MDGKNCNTLKARNLAQFFVKIKLKTLKLKVNVEMIHQAGTKKSSFFSFFFQLHLVFKDASGEVSVVALWLKVYCVNIALYACSDQLPKLFGRSKGRTETAEIKSEI